ncbi:MAG: F420-dependent methylenetetrahydromethanopterin dehydrogenase [Candidatus Bathyarchaeota archaeon]|jgi:methylenetetrahydromethanopterin dehydrogenase
MDESLPKIKIGVFKCGNVGTAPIFELLLDELAQRKDITVRTVTTGAKMSLEEVKDALPKIFEFELDLLVLISPNPAVSGPAAARSMALAKGVHTIVMSDAVAKRMTKELEKQGLGYIVVLGDPLIGARRQFLDPVEMALFNTNIIKILAITGVFRLIHQEVDRVIAVLKEGLAVRLPRLVIDTETIRDNSDFANPYAKAKAMAAYHIASKIPEINTKACFMEKESEKFIPLVTCAHEMAQVAAKLAEEAREIEKYSDSLVRKPHSKKGEPLTKTKLMQSPTFDDELYKKWLKTLPTN